MKFVGLLDQLLDRFTIEIDFCPWHHFTPQGRYRSCPHSDKITIVTHPMLAHQDIHLLVTPRRRTIAKDRYCLREITMIGKHQGDTGRSRGDRLIKERVHDPYMAGAKPAGPIVCPDCGVLYEDGRWQWSSERPENAREDLCPACRRTRDHVPAGILVLRGAYLGKHRDAIMRLVANKVERQKAAHPLERILKIDDTGPNEIVIEFTDTHLPSGVGKALQRAHNGDLDIQFADETNIVRVFWER
jgi:hypothetical protein